MIVDTPDQSPVILGPSSPRAVIARQHHLDAHARIAFSGIELEVYVCDVEPNVFEQLDLRDAEDEFPDRGAVLALRLR